MMVSDSENQENVNLMGSPEKHSFDYLNAYKFACRFKYTVPKRAPIEFLLKDIHENRPEQKYIQQLEKELLKPTKMKDKKQMVTDAIKGMKVRLERKNNVNELKTYLTGFPRILKKGTDLCFSHHKNGEYLELALFQKGFDPFNKQHSPNGEMGYFWNIKPKSIEERNLRRRKCQEETEKYTGVNGTCVSYALFYEKEMFEEETDDILEKMSREG
ncbi:unnamed protein product [Caenorhabditis angaria]|uniref:Uncharacterized protein n=1 Tax=Caenorhabditis angaria TaxID=860376 RepID=A0A9P1IIE2_9PELO|nr:unnamed protein product [Caenorhabditis angaria]